MEAQTLSYKPRSVQGMQNCAIKETATMLFRGVFGGDAAYHCASTDCKRAIYTSHVHDIEYALRKLTHYIENECAYTRKECELDYAGKSLDDALVDISERVYEHLTAKDDEFFPLSFDIGPFVAWNDLDVYGRYHYTRELPSSSVVLAVALCRAVGCPPLPALTQACALLNERLDELEPAGA
jgi:hypothetical protein